jgi:hypothetical protein
MEEGHALKHGARHRHTLPRHTPDRVHGRRPTGWNTHQRLSTPPSSFAGPARRQSRNGGHKPRAHGCDGCSDCGERQAQKDCMLMSGCGSSRDGRILLVAW